MSKQFEIKTTSFMCSYRIFGRCINLTNKSIGNKIVFETQINIGICSEEYCPMIIEE